MATNKALERSGVRSAKSTTKPVDSVLARRPRGRPKKIRIGVREIGIEELKDIINADLPNCGKCSGVILNKLFETIHRELVGGAVVTLPEIGQLEKYQMKATKFVSPYAHGKVPARDHIRFVMDKKLKAAVRSK